MASEKVLGAAATVERDTLLSGLQTITPAGNSNLVVVDSDGIVKQLGESSYKDNVLSGAVKRLPVTVGNCENTTAEKTILQFTIPANEMQDGGVILVWFVTRIKVNTSMVQLNRKILVNNVTVHDPFGSVEAQGEYHHIREMAFYREGNDLYFTKSHNYGNYHNAFTTGELRYAGGTYSQFTSDNGFSYTTNFSGNITIKFNVKWATAHIDNYVRVPGANVLLINP